MEQLDPDKLKLFSFLLFSKLEGAVTSGMVHLGDSTLEFAKKQKREEF
jgi:hypothetical protein